MLFSIQILIKKYWKIDFSAFGKICFGECFFSFQILIKKVLKNWFFQLLTRFGFGECFFLLKIKSIEKLFFSAFGKALVLANVLFLYKFYFKKHWKIDFFSFWQDGFGECFFLFKFYWKKYWKIDFSSFWQGGFGACFFLFKF